MLNLKGLFKKEDGKPLPAVPAGAPPNGFTEIEKEGIDSELVDSWKDLSIPQRQYEVAKKALEDFSRGAPVIPFDVLVEILTCNIKGFKGKKLLEVGCSSGYYSEVLKIKGIDVEYSGCDYSASFIELARELYPGTDFQVQDARELSYQSGSFEIVVSGGCLVHIKDYEKAVREASRTAKEYVVFHRTPVLHKKKTSYYVKTAYGVRMFDVHINERELLGLIKDNAMRVVDIATFDVSPQEGEGDILAFKTYLCRKV